MKDENKKTVVQIVAEKIYHPKDETE
jgi:hypothetical protein